MGRLIDADELLKAMDTWDKFGFEHTGCFVREPKDDFVTYVHYEDMLKSVNGMPTVEAIPKADYENRLKADMVAMLTDIQLEIREYHEIGCDEDCNNCRMVGCVEPVNVIKDLDIIQQKIDALKGN